MNQFTTLTSRMVLIPYNDIDTDQIIPAQYLKVTDKAGLAEGLFSRWRYGADGAPDMNFPLNQPESQGVQVLLVGDNFGCGSSREHAPWALVGGGIRALISTSFADIFRGNALKNGLLPVQVTPETYATLVRLYEADPGIEVTVDLAAQTLHYLGGKASFPIDAFSKTCLLEGVDSLGYLLKHEAEVAAYEARIQEEAHG